MRLLWALTWFSCLSTCLAQTGSEFIYHIGEQGVGVPVVIEKGKAEFPSEACAAGREAAYRAKSTDIGSAVVSLVVSADGRARDVRVTRTVGLDLGQQAVRAVRKFKFKPAAMRDGRPVAVYSTIEVYFHLPRKCFTSENSR